MLPVIAPSLPGDSAMGMGGMEDKKGMERDRLLLFFGDKPN
jgi:hypothetical protein